MNDNNRISRPRIILKRSDLNDCPLFFEKMESFSAHAMIF